MEVPYSMSDILSYLKDRRFHLFFAFLPHLSPSERVLRNRLRGSRSQSIQYGGLYKSGFEAIAFMKRFVDKPEEALSEIMPPVFEPDFTLEQMQQRCPTEKHEYGHNKPVAHLLAYDEHYVTRIMEMGMDVLKLADDLGETVAHVMARNYPKTHAINMVNTYPGVINLQAKNGTSVGWIVYANADPENKETLRKTFPDILNSRTFGNIRIETALKMEDLLRLVESDSPQAAKKLNEGITKALLL